MKKIFKKNQIIISALAIMIAVAGYINFTKDKSEDLLDAGNQGNAVLSGDMADNESIQNTDNTLSDLEFADISDEDDIVLNNSLHVGDNGELILKENQLAKTDDNNEDVNTSSDTDAPGEAVLASTSLNSGFFSTAKLAREQTRSKNKQALMEIVADTSVTDEQKQTAIDCIIQMTETAEMENAAELLLEAKGFEGVVVNIVDGNVDVVVNSEYITDAQIAQIEDIVMRKTKAAPEQIVITSVVVEE